jgi:hypothetical protein
LIRVQIRTVIPLLGSLLLTLTNRSADFVKRLNANLAAELPHISQPNDGSRSESTSVSSAFSEREGQSQKNTEMVTRSYGFALWKLFANLSSLTIPMPIINHRDMDPSNRWAAQHCKTSLAAPQRLIGQWPSCYHSRRLAFRAVWLSEIEFAN